MPFTPLAQEGNSESLVLLVSQGLEFDAWFAALNNDKMSMLALTSDCPELFGTLKQAMVETELFPVALLQDSPAPGLAEPQGHSGTYQWSLRLPTEWF